MDNKQKEIEDIENSIDENEEEEEEDSEQNEQEKKTSEKDVDKRNSEEENAAEELFIPHIEKNKDFFLMQDDNGYQSDSSSDSGEIDAKEEESLTRHILNQLLYLNKMTRNKKKQKEKRFIPSVKNFLKLDFEKKIEKVTNSDFLVKNLIKLTQGVVNKKIHVEDISKSDLRMLQHICDNDALYVDKKAILAEDHRVHMILKDALKEVEKEQKRLLQKNGK